MTGAAARADSGWPEAGGATGAAGRLPAAEVLAGFFGVGPAWSDDATGRYRFRIDAPAGGWLECYVAELERLVSIRVADGAVHALHVDLTLEGVEEVAVRAATDGEAWLEIRCGRRPGAVPCTASVALRPEILVVLGYGQR